MVGAHFEDYASMQGLKTPEYSHLSRACAVVYTDADVRALAALALRLMLRADAPAVLSLSKGEPDLFNGSMGRNCVSGLG